MIDRIWVDSKSGALVHRIGSAGGRFPLSFRVDRTDPDIQRVSIVAVRVTDCAPVLVDLARPTIVAFNISHNTFGADGELLDPIEIARSTDTAAVGYQTDWAVPGAGRHLGRPHHGAVALPKSGLPEFLRRINHHDLELIDASDAPSVDGFDEFILRWNTATKPGLAGCPDARFYLRSHDDCYLNAESRCPSMTTDILRIGIGIHFGAHLVQGQATDGTTVTLPPATLVRALTDNAASWTSCAPPSGHSSSHGHSTETGTITLFVAPVEWRLGDSLPTVPTRRIEYEPVAATWSIHLTRP